MRERPPKRKSSVNQEIVFPWNQATITKMRSESELSFKEFSQSIGVDKSTVRR